MAKDKLRVGVIGTGMIAVQAHIPGWKAQAQDAEIVACADVLADRAKYVAEHQQLGQAYGDWEKMLREQELDVVLVCTPNCYHKPQAVAALQAGAHVLCEKPAATSCAEAVEMFDAATKAKRHLFIGQSARFLHRSRAAKEMIENGRLGEVYFAEATAMRRRGIPKWGQFHMKTHSAGGPILDMGVHAIDLLYWLLGNPKVVAVSAAAYTKIGHRNEGVVTSDKESGAFEGVLTARPYSHKDFDVEDMAAGFIRLDCGITVAVKTSWAANIPSNASNTMILGSEAGLMMEPLTLVVNHGSYQSNVEIKLPEEPHGWFTGQHREAAHFVKVIRGEEDLIVRREQVLNVMKTLDAFYQSAAEGRELTVN